jgi:hypothetical protein
MTLHAASHPPGLVSFPDSAALGLAEHRTLPKFPASMDAGFRTPEDYLTETRRGEPGHGDRQEYQEVFLRCI